MVHLKSAPYNNLKLKEKSNATGKGQFNNAGLFFYKKINVFYSTKLNYKRMLNAFPKYSFNVSYVSSHKTFTIASWWHNPKYVTINAAVVFGFR